MRYVMKFGGTSVGNAKRIRKVAEIVKDEFEENEVCVVVSAVAKVTDMLIKTANRMLELHEDEDGIREEIDRTISELERIHLSIVEENIKKDRSVVEANIYRELDSLERVLTGVAYLGELSERSLDYVSSFGERFSAPIVAGTLRETGVPSKALYSHEIGIITDTNYGSATPDMEKTRKNLRENVLPLLREGVPVITGFFAKSYENTITTFGRGGSDYTASIVGACIDADEIWIWTDVNGVMTADPKIVGNKAKTIPELSFAEAMELSFFGAKILYPKTLDPAIERDIPVRVKNTLNPENPGTVIVKECKKSDKVVKAISAIRDCSLITVWGSSISCEPKISYLTLGALYKSKIEVSMISQASSSSNISFIVKKKDSKKAFELIKKEVGSINEVKEITCEDNISTISLVGEGMRGTPGVAAKVFSTMAENGINIMMISQGSSELNISFAIESRHLNKAVNSLHDVFSL
mgnify:CR=1 FL=1